MLRSFLLLVLGSLLVACGGEGLGVVAEDAGATDAQAVDTGATIDTGVPSVDADTPCSNPVQLIHTADNYCVFSLPNEARGRRFDLYVFGAHQAASAYVSDGQHVTITSTFVCTQRIADGLVVMPVEILIECSIPPTSL